MSDRNDDSTPYGDGASAGDRQPSGEQQPYGQQPYGQQEPSGQQSPYGQQQSSGQQPGAYSQPPAYAASGYGSPAPKRTLSIISMIAGIVGLVGAGVVFIPFVGGILQLFIPGAAVVLGFLGRSREGAPARGFWLTGLITGFIGLAFAILSFVLWGVLFSIPEFQEGFESGSSGYNP